MGEVFSCVIGLGAAVMMPVIIPVCQGGENLNYGDMDKVPLGEMR